MTPTELKMIRALDVAAAMKDAERRGIPFRAGVSEANGAEQTAEAVALMALHKLRTKVGSKSEIRASREWLSANKFTGLFGGPVYHN